MFRKKLPVGNRKITIVEKKRLTEKLLKLHWHSRTGDQFCCACGAKGPSTNYNFDNDSDMMMVRRALRYENQWGAFYDFAMGKVIVEKQSINFYHSELMSWLDQNPHRFCILVAMFLKIS